MANKDDPYQDQEVSSFLSEVWGRRAQGLPPLEEVMGTVRPEDVRYLCDHYYPFLQILSSEAHLGEIMEPKFITAESGWVIHEYGVAMSASPGEFLIGDYWAEEEDEEGGEGKRTLLPGKGTVVLQQIQTAQAMMQLAQKNGWPGVEIIDGTPKMKWAGWMAAKDLGLEIEGYEPSEKEQAKRKRIQKRMAEVTKESGPSVSPKK